MYKAKHFELKEFSCNCGCGLNKTVDEVLQVLDDVREHFGVPVVVTSGTRCTAWNTQVGGKPNSKHLDGTAADIKVLGVPPSEVHQYLVEKYPDKYGIGKYRAFTHVDTRSTKARW